MSESPPAIHAEAHVVDHDRVLRVILALEGHKWHWAGGAYAFMPASWAEETSLPYALASNPAQAAIIAKIRLARFHAISTSRGIRWTPILAIECWRRGLEGGLKRAVRGRHSDYARRGENLFRDPTFP